MPSVSNFAWQLITGTTAPAPRLAAPNTERSLEEKLEWASPKEKITLINEAAQQLAIADINHELKDECSSRFQVPETPSHSREEFNDAFDYLNTQLLKKDSRAKTQREIWLPPASDSGREDFIRLTRHGINLNTLCQRYQIPPPQFSATLTSLVTPKVVAALMACCPTQDSSRAEDRLLQVNKILNHLSHELMTKNHEKQPIDRKQNNDGDCLCLSDLISRSKSAAEKNFELADQRKLLITFKANLHWAQHYSDQSKVTENNNLLDTPKTSGSQSPKSVMFFPSE
jgi:hypothetical protein